MAERQRDVNGTMAHARRQEIRAAIERLAQREAALWDGKTMSVDARIKAFAEFAGAASVVCETVIIHLNALDRLAGR